MLSFANALGEAWRMAWKDVTWRWEITPEAVTVVLWVVKGRKGFPPLRVK